MARKPNLTSPLTVIRTAFGLDAGRFAKLVGCGKSTIQHIETGDRIMKGDLADKIHLFTGVPRDWLNKDSLDLEMVRGWLQKGRFNPATGKRWAFKPQSLLERNAAGGPFFVGWATFPSREILPKLQAAFYACGLKNINPYLVVLAVGRAIDDAISRFGLDRNAVARLCEETERYHYGTLAKDIAETETQQASPGYLALEKYYEATNLRLDEAEKVQRGEKATAIWQRVTGEYNTLRKKAGLPTKS
jgi:transcriptional regulator with XRE-family HTH domain